MYYVVTIATLVTMGLALIRALLGPSVYDRVLAVNCPAEQQIRRLMKRDNIDEDLARSMLAQQLGNAQRRARAHDIIDNHEDDADLQVQVNALHQSYLQMSADQ